MSWLVRHSTPTKSSPSARVAPGPCCVNGNRTANVWLGVSIENDDHVDRADLLREVPAAIRFISCETLLGSLPSLDLTHIDWLIVGAESGAEARPIQETWVLDIRDSCLAAGVSFFFKHWGGRTPKAGGRTLAGRTWDQMP
jgi:protein gp37